MTIRGHDGVVVIAAEELERQMPSASHSVPFATFMEGLSVDGLDRTRDRDLGRDIGL